MKATKILIVEDDRIIAEDIKKTLGNLGYNICKIVSSGIEAIEKAEEDNPDLVLMDIVLNREMSGIEAAEQIRTRFNIPVVYLTAYTDEEILERAKVTEPYGYILKPFNDRELCSNIEMAIYKNRTQRALQKSEARLQNIIKRNADGIVIVNKDGEVRFVNPAAVCLFGKNEKEILGGLFGFPVMVGETTEIDVVSRNGVVSAEMRVVETEWDGEPAYLATLRDITERKRAERALHESYEKTKRILEETVEALASALEKRDPYTAGHSQRVAHLAFELAKELDLSEAECNGIYMASVIHDIGKIYVPSQILSKPGRLTEAEFDIVKSHCKIGYDILKAVEFPWPVALIVLQHHERLNGSGYPKGLKNSKILIEAKILGVADVVEAMLSHRPYRPAPGLKKALEEISRNKGILYDPEVVEACLLLFKEKKFRVK